MKLASFLLASAVAVSAIYAQDTVESGDVAIVTDANPVATGSATSDSTTTDATNTTPDSPSNADSGNVEVGPNPLDSLTSKKYSSQWNMEPIRVVHARVQGDTPALREGRFVSQFGDGLEGGYLSGMDSVNTASVDGALMYVQAEGINIKKRDKRCERKYKMRNIVFYEILIAQTNETIAQFQDTWSTPEYGPMIPMDGGRCTPLKGNDVLPVECYQFNGEKDHPNLGPFVGGENKELDDRAPYPGNYWFSFPNTCPTKGWGEKSDECRVESRKGLCPIDQAPNGVDCTFAYNILGWVPIDDVVGITSMKNEATGNQYESFEEWCEASEDHIEFEGDSKNDMAKGLDFWSDPLDKEANQARTQKMLDAYTRLLMYKNSTQVNETTVAYFRPLPTVESLTEMNPPCYKSVPSCGSGNGCKRVGHAQLCTPCKSGETCPKGEDGFKFPKLEKALTKLSEKELTTPKEKFDDAISDAKKEKKGSGEKGGNGSAATGLSIGVASAMMVSAMVMNFL